MVKDLVLVCVVVFVLLCGLGQGYGADPTNDTITNIGEVVNYTDTANIILPNNGSVVNVNESCHIIQPKVSDVMYSDLPRISMYAKPSCGCRYSYAYWYCKSFVNYCPYCKKYNALLKNPKGVYEREYTCKFCRADFCAVCGKEKYSWSNVYLQRW